MAASDLFENNWNAYKESIDIHREDDDNDYNLVGARNNHFMADSINQTYTKQSNHKRKKHWSNLYFNRSTIDDDDNETSDGISIHKAHQTGFKSLL